MTYFYSYLSKKIALPNECVPATLSWDSFENWLVYGASDDSGYLKLLKMDKPVPELESSITKHITSQTLIGHSGSVRLAKWNNSQNKLATADSKGLTIIWSFNVNGWTEEMNHARSCKVADIKWDKKGQHICICYQDGHTILGSADGVKIWSKDLVKDIAAVEWSPLGDFILVGTSSGSLYVYDFNGNLAYEMKAQSQDNDPINFIQWSLPSEALDRVSLVIGFKSGLVKMFKSEKDLEPKQVQPTIENSIFAWDPFGSVVAIAGTRSKNTIDSKKGSSVIEFYSMDGQLLYSLNQLPIPNIKAISWEYSGHRLAIAFEGYLYFATVKRNYQYSSVDDYLVFVTRDFDFNNELHFWKDEKNHHFRPVKNVSVISSNKKHLLLIEESSNSSDIQILSSSAQLIASKKTTVKPIFWSIGQKHAFVADHDHVAVLEFSSKVDTFKTLLNESSDFYFHIDDLSQQTNVSSISSQLIARPSNNPLVFLTCSDSYLYLLKANGDLFLVNLDSLVVDIKYSIKINGQVVFASVNSNDTCIAIVNSDNELSLISLDYSDDFKSFSRTSVGQFVWAQDSPKWFLTFEKGKCNVFNDSQLVETSHISGYLCSFNQLQFKSLLLEDISFNTEEFNQSFILDKRTSIIDDFYEQIKSRKWKTAIEQANQIQNESIWRSLAHEAMLSKSWEIASNCFVKIGDYASIQFIKQIETLDTKHKQSAQVNAYLGQLDDAVQLYMSSDRKDLAIDLKFKMGDWIQVLQLVETGGSVDDTFLSKVYHELGVDSKLGGKFSTATQYFKRAGSKKELAACMIQNEDWQGLLTVASELVPNNPLLIEIAESLALVGMYQESVATYLKAGAASEAKAMCLKMCQWDLAAEISKEYSVGNADDTLDGLVKHLMSQDKLVDAVNLLRKASKYKEAGKLMYQLADKASTKDFNPLELKQLYVLAALEIERQRYHDSTSKNASEQTEKLINQMLQENINSSGHIGKPWYAAEAYHFYNLSLNLLEQDAVSSFIASTRLLQYLDVIDKVKAYSLICISSLKSGQFKTFAQIIDKLSLLTDSQDRDRLRELKKQVLQSNNQVDNCSIDTLCSNCGMMLSETSSKCDTCSTAFKTCMATARSIIHDDCVMCATCKHVVMLSASESLSFCPLCHSDL